MKKAVFSFKEYKFLKVEMDLFDLKFSTIELDIEPKGVFNLASKKYKLEFVFKAFEEGNDGENKKQIILVQCIADFEFNEISSFEEIPDYFYSNSIAIVFPYIRAFISTITLQANIPPIIIPTMNLTSLQEKLKSNTKEI
jgi:preprotein translocase subunit SecB